MTLSDWIEHLPFLNQLTADEKRRLETNAQLVEVPSHTKLFSPGDECGAFLLVIDGSVRVQMVGDNGREIVLYRVESGQTCVLTTACLLSHEAYNAEALTEEKTTAIALPARAFQEFLATSNGFRDLVFASYGQRISSLVLLVEEVAFKRIDVRLAQFIDRHKDKDGIVKKTHYDLAVELGSAREVISRQLKEFEKKGWIELLRGKLIVKNPEDLKTFISRHCD
ncbi:Crp/Fnr family transcriptional regulator [Terasakiella sp.]|uniref:Crp/Fnr family transcriptional regulator n=1 Tax=Terasakiella sp. TaxID=2034861 RepID=UPI003AA964F8